MEKQICDICKKEPVRVHLTGLGDYCLNCYNRMVLDKYGIEDTFEYPKTMSVMESSGSIHTFHIEHMVLGDRVSWDAFETEGHYHFREISDAETNGAAVAQRFFRKIVNGICTKSLYELEHRADNLLSRDGKSVGLREKGTINIIEDEDRGYATGFEIDGKKFTGEDLERLLGSYPGFSLQYQIHDASDPILKEDEYLVPVYITKESLTDEFQSVLNIYGDGGFVSYKDTMIFDEAFYKVTDKLKVLANSEKRADAIEAGKRILRILTHIETDDDYFPIYDIELVCKIVDPYETDAEIKAIVEEYFQGL